jgi:DNA-binding transcriptional LysR family regulator
MDVELRHLRCLVAIAEEGTVTDAAIALGLTQPAVSRTLAQLEERVGVRLVERTTRHLALTPAGVAFRDEALRALAAVDDAVAAATGTTRALRLGYSWAAAGEHTSALLRQWRVSHPTVPLQLVRSDDRSAGLIGGTVDLALVRVPLPSPHIVTEQLFVEPRVVALAADHLLASRKRLTLSDLSGDTLVTTSVYGTTSVDLWLPGEAPREVVDVGNVDEWLNAVGSGVGVGVTPASTAHQHSRADIAFIPLRGAPPVPTYLAYDDRRTHPMQAQFLALARRVVRGRRSR